MSSKAEYETAVQMAHVVNSMQESDYGSETYAFAFNAFFDQMETKFPAIFSDQWYVFAIKATNAELIEQALANARNVYGPF